MPQATALRQRPSQAPRGSILGDMTSSRPHLLTSITRRGSLFAAAGVALAVFAWSGPDATAKDRGPINPLTRHLAGLQVGPGHEFRMLVVHPLQAPATAAAPTDVELAAFANPDTIGIASKSPKRTRPMHFDNFGEARLVLVPGQVVRADRIDLAVTDHAVVRKRSRIEIPLVAASSDAKASEERPEKSILKTFLPPTLRWHAMQHPKSQEMREEVQDWADRAQQPDGRRSPADLRDAPVIAERVEEYARALSGVTSSPAGLQTVGYAAVLDGTPIVFETFGDGELFRQAWPGILRGMAAEAALKEVKESLLDQEIPPSGQPDRFLAPVREVILSFYGSDVEVGPVRADGKRYSVTTPTGTLHGLVLDRTTLVHLIMVTDPRRRGTGDDDTDFDPGVISRKARPTEAEKRWLDRRNKRKPAPPPPVPVPPVPGNGGG